MNTIGGQIQSQNLLKIKKIVDNDNNGDKFVIINRDETAYDKKAGLVFHEDMMRVIRGVKK